MHTLLCTQLLTQEIWTVNADQVTRTYKVFNYGSQIVCIGFGINSAEASKWSK
jgi:hypothetical protein